MSDKCWLCLDIGEVMQDRQTGETFQADLHLKKRILEGTLDAELRRCPVCELRALREAAKQAKKGMEAMQRHLHVECHHSTEQDRVDMEKMLRGYEALHKTLRHISGSGAGETEGQVGKREVAPTESDDQDRNLGLSSSPAPEPDPCAKCHRCDTERRYHRGLDHVFFVPRPPPEGKP